MLSLSIMLIFLLFLFMIGMPIGFAMIFVGAVGIFTASDYSAVAGVLSSAVYRSVNSFDFSSIPLFILMAHFISQSKIADELFDSIMKWVGHLPGGAAITTVLASAGFGTLSGSSVAATSVMSNIAVPKMIQANYSPAFSAGLVASSTGTLAVLIPPSIPLILYGIQTETSIGQLLVGGIIPGILLAFLLSLYAIYEGNKSKIKNKKYSWKERWASLITIWPILILILLVVSFIYLGFGTVTEAASFGALGALIIGLILRRLNLKNIVDSLLITLSQTAMIFIIITGATILTYYITMTRVGNDILMAVESSGLPGWAIIVIIVIFYLFLGLFMEVIGAMLLTLPLLFPLIIGLGYHPVWFGVIVVLLLEIGLVTPPVGINLFITSQQTGISTRDVFRGAIPFIFILLITVVILIIFPQLILYLPSKM